MKKIFILIVLVFGWVLNVQALDSTIIGLNVHYEPTAGEFVKGVDNWTYNQEK